MNPVNPNRFGYLIVCQAAEMTAVWCAKESDVQPTIDELRRVNPQHDLEITVLSGRLSGMFRHSGSFVDA